MLRVRFVLVDVQILQLIARSDDQNWFPAPHSANNLWNHASPVSFLKEIQDVDASRELVHLCLQLPQEPNRPIPEGERHSLGLQFSVLQITWDDDDDAIHYKSEQQKP